MRTLFKFNPRGVALATVAASLSLTSPAHSQVNVSFDPGTTNVTTALTGFMTTGDLMAGMEVTAFFANGADETVIWVSTGAPNGEAAGTNWKLSEMSRSVPAPTKEGARRPLLTLSAWPVSAEYVCDESGLVSDDQHREDPHHGVDVAEDLGR